MKKLILLFILLFFIIVPAYAVTAGFNIRLWPQEKSYFESTGTVIWSSVSRQNVSALFGLGFGYWSGGSLGWWQQHEITLSQIANLLDLTLAVNRLSVPGTKLVGRMGPSYKYYPFLGALSGGTGIRAVLNTPLKITLAYAPTTTEGKLYTYTQGTLVVRADTNFKFANIPINIWGIYKSEFFTGGSPYGTPNTYTSVLSFGGEIKPFSNLEIYGEYASSNPVKPAWVTANWVLGAKITQGLPIGTFSLDLSYNDINGTVLIGSASIPLGTLGKINAWIGYRSTVEFAQDPNLAWYIDLTTLIGPATNILRAYYRYDPSERWFRARVITSSPTPVDQEKFVVENSISISW
ncbi:MAG: hypothetical protein NZ841_02835 [Dictyoglomus sp.]|nr:hypothetical protein [Dictyoglomus sp.]MDW8188213.1 hypothetical protein [Dictyoglomus sp.]